MENDIFIQYLIEHYAKNGTINDIQVRDEVEYKGQVLKIGSFLKNTRSSHKKYVKSKGKRIPTELTMKRYIILEKLGIIWDLGHFKEISKVSEEREIRYLKEHFKKFGTINDIGKDTVVKFEDKPLYIGRYLSKIRGNHSCFLREKNLSESASPLSLERYRLLDEMNIMWSIKRGKKIAGKEEDIRIRYLREYYKKHGTINDISTTAIVEFEGETLKIGYFLNMVRKQHRKYLEGIDYLGSVSEVAIERYEILDSMGIVWDVKTKRVQIKDDYDPYIEYLKEHYEKYGTINDIKVKDVVEFNGTKLNIGNFLDKMRRSYANYTSPNESTKKVNAMTIRRIQILDELEFTWKIEKGVSYTQIAKNNGISRSAFTKAIHKFGGDVEKALKICLSVKKERERTSQNTSKDYSLESILQEFEIDFETLLKYLNKDNLRTQPKDAIIMYDSSMSLRNFCIKNGYNYQIILKAIRLRKEVNVEEDLESLINRSIVEYRVNGQSSPATWVYSKYGNEVLLKHLFLAIGFDHESILKDMSEKAINLDIAFENESFRRNKTKAKGYLEGIYHDIIAFYRSVNDSDEYTEETASDALVEHIQEIVTEYHLSIEEFTVLNNSFKHYINAVHQYRLFDVAFEKDNERKVQKIVDYKLDADDIEEAFFLPLKFDEKVLVGRDSELYKRRVLLKNLTVSWNELSEEEKTKKTINYNLTGEELQYITTTRQSIDETKEKVYKKQ